MPFPTHADRVAVVTGGARGFGLAIALGLASRGANIVILDRLPAADAVTQVEALGVKALSVVVDITEPNDVEAAAREALAHFGQVDILVNCAGIIAVDDFWETDFTAWRRVHSINLDAQFLTAKAFAPSMRDNGWGRIVNISSNTLGLTAPHLVPYMSSKGGVVGFTRGLATDLAEHGITVNSVAPTATSTPGGKETITPEAMTFSANMQAIKRNGTAEDIVGTVCFLTSDDAAFTTGQTLVADGGWWRV